MPSNIVCPHCAEESPAHAVMCWNCYSPLPGTDNARDQTRASREAAIRRSHAGPIKVERPRSEEIKDAAYNGLGFGVLALGLASGYLPKRRGALIGAGVACFAALFAWGKWDEHRLKVQNQSLSESDGENPNSRILNTILLYAVRDGATQIRLRAGFGVRVCYLINGEWHEQMRIPSYAWGMLRAFILERTDNWQNSIRFEHEGMSSEFWTEWEVDPEHPIEVVTFTPQEVKPPRPPSYPQIAK